MFDFGLSFSHIMVIVILAVIVIGPKDLPTVLMRFGQGVNKLRRMAGDFQGQVDSAMKDAGLADVRKDLASLATGVSAVMAPMQTALIATATSASSKPLAVTEVNTPAIGNVATSIVPGFTTSTATSGLLSFAEGSGETRIMGKRLSDAVT